MKARNKNEKIPIESKAYPGEFFFFVRVNELLQGLGSLYNVELIHLDIIKPFAELGLLNYHLQNNKTQSNKTINKQHKPISSTDNVLKEKV